MAGISKKKIKYKDGTEKIFYTISYRDTLGKQHTSGCFKKKTEAMKHINEFENVNPNISEITFGKIFKIFQEHAKKKYSHTTNSTYDIFFGKKYLGQLFEVKYNRVTPLDLERFITNIEEKHSPYVAEMCLKIARAGTNYAKRLELIKENKFNAVTKIKVPKKPKYHLTESQEKQVLKCCKELYPQYYDLFYTIMGTGMREGEAFALTKGDLDFDKKKLIINKQFTKGQLRLIPKGHSYYRYVYLTDDIIELLKKRIETYTDDSMLLFSNRINGYINACNLRERVWKPLLIYAGINERVRIHDLRGSYVDIGIVRGVPIKFIQQQLGHAKVQMTLDIYANNNPDMIDNALKNLNGILKDDNNEK